MTLRAGVGAVLAAALVAFAGGDAQASLIANGSFETGNILATNSSESGNAAQYLPSWTFADPFHSDRVSGPAYGYIWYPSAASQGAYYVGLNWSPLLGVLTNTLSQAFTLPAGSTGINLSFDMSSEFGVTTSTLVADILDSGATVVASTGVLTHTAGNAHWDSKSFTASLTPGSYTLRFTAVTNGHADDVLLDNVVLDAVSRNGVAVPEPSSLLILAGMLPAMLVRRRRA